MNTTHQVPTAPRLIQRLDSEPFALSFSGQGYPWLETLREAIAAGATIDSELARARELLEPLEDELAAFFPHGFEPVAWAKGVPAFDLSAAAVSTPGIVTAQIATLRTLEAQGLELAAARAVIGHSQGTLATYVAGGRADAATVIALAQLIGAAITLTARREGLVRSAAGAPMVALGGVDRNRAQRVIDALGVGSVVGLVNGRENVVVTGAPEDNARVVEELEQQAAREAKALEGKERGGRGLELTVNPLDVQAAYHHPAMEAAVERVQRWAAVVGIDAELVVEAARAVLTERVDWPARVREAIASGARWIFECGPGRGAEALTAEAAAGRGVGTLNVASNQAALFDAGAAPELPRPYSAFAPKRFVHNGQARLMTRFTEQTGCSPVILGGMTPTTVDPAIVAAAANAGYWAELAGGGQVTEEVLNANLDRLTRLLDPGINAQFNAMYLSPKQWRTQVEGKRVVPRRRASGLPVNGLVCSAGIPPHEEAVQLVRQLRADNIPYVAFKPGAVAHIDRVLAVADDLPEVPIIMQVEGGKAGGHHSWEDLDDLLVARYAQIRRRDNVSLLVGGGIGTPERGAEYLTGSWAKAYGLAPMPVDGIIIGTAAMACKESTASPAVKRALVEATGIPAAVNGGWVGAGRAEHGMASSLSQLGADIHEIDNSWARCARLLDEVAGDDAAVQARRQEIVNALARTAKPYFGDVEDMTYETWLERYLELSYRGGWADASWARRFGKMLDRAEARLTPADHGEFAARVAFDARHPGRAVRALVAAYPAATKQRVHASDAAFFLDLLSGAGKPANFVPVLDANVRRWWRADSLWQAHDERYGADEVSIIPGTAAVAGIDRVDEPVAQLLGRFESVAAERVLAEAKVPGFLERALACPSISWAGRQQPNPLRALRVGQTSQLATLNADGANSGTLTVPLPESGGELRLPIRLADDAPLNATVEVGEGQARAAMGELTRLVAGGELPEVIDGAARWTAQLTADHIAAYDNVTAGYLPGARGTAADVLVGRAWPAIFAVIAGAKAGDNSRVVEGMLNLVHLEHNLELHRQPEPGELRVTARLRQVADTELGRIVDVAVDIDSRGEPVASLNERFAIRGRRGTQAAGRLVDPREERATAASFRHEATVTAPPSMRPFAVVTGDRNPIHLSEAAARMAGLEGGVIVHGMWTSALGQLAASFDGARLRSWDATMLAPVLPGTEVTYVVERVALDSGGEVRAVTATAGGETVLQARATMAAPRTFYGFPGQGIQAQAMGMDSYATSAAARAVWDRADRHTRRELGFSILEIVRNNPASVVVDGEEFTHPDGALFLTQFTQVAMATLGCAQVAEMEEAGVLQRGAFFAGHSVGEYNALAAYARVLSLEAVVEIVYRRGLTMHRLVDRDDEGNSNYGLAALRPNKIGVSATEVFDYVAAIAQESGEFLEIVNYNIAGMQYAVAGTRTGLRALARDVERRAPGQRGLVMIPGIDVPFHSSHLLDGVADFREHLDSLIPEDIDLDALVGRYVPNLVARPFEISREFVESMAAVVDSAQVRSILDNFGQAAANPVRTGRTLLIELLAWQFASPVRWIETQDLLLSPADAGLGVERFVEVGVGTSPTLANMLGQTLRLPRYREAAGRIEVFNIERDRAAAFAEDATERPVPQAPEPTRQPAEEAREVAPAPAAGGTPAPAAPADLAFGAAEATEMLVALWTKVRPDQIGATDSIEALVEGVSSRRNQLLMDLGTEFGLGAIEGAADADIAELKDTVAGRAKGYTAFGPVLSVQVGEALRRITGPAGKKPAYLAERVAGTWRLGPGWVDRVSAELVLGAREGASLRGGELAVLSPQSPANPADLDALIDAAVAAAGRKAGIAITKPSAAGGGAAKVDSAALDELAESITGDGGILAETARGLLARLGLKPPSTPIAGDTDENAALAQLVTNELGADWPRQVAPAFDANKAVLLDDRWASAREDLVRVAAGQLDADAVNTWGAGEAVAHMADYLGLESLARNARENPESLEYNGQVAVLTGASPNSIAAEIAGELLSGGATVIATTSRLSHERLEFYKDLYRTRAAGNAALWVVPANLASYADLDALIQWIGTEQTATVGGAATLIKPALTPDLLFPFAAPPVSGTLLDAGPRTESQMRLLLWAVERLIAGLSSIGADTNVRHRLHVVIPGSPNRGRFGGDGAYGESKAALDALVARWNAEPVWAQRASLVHAHIGWTRGTGLMAGNDKLVEAVEARGIKTFSQPEMARALLLEGASREARARAARAPFELDLTGGLAEADLDLSALAKEVAPERTVDAETPRTLRALPTPYQPIEWTRPDFGGVTQALDDMVVIVGAGELGPLGSARTRFDVEVSGRLSAAGVTELAWATGLISWDGAWVDRDGQEVAEEDIHARFHDEVLARVGVRRYHDDFGPRMPMVDNLAPELTTVYLENPITFSVPDEQTARSFAGIEGASVRFDGTEWRVTRPAGSEVRVPRRVAMTRFVGGQIPEGFDPARYGIPADMVDNLDRVAVWNLVCTVDAFVSAGFSPAELLEHLHPARVSSTQGTGMGGMESLRSLYIDKLLGQPRPNDILQEALPNVIAAHVMQSYVGGYGQMVHPVAACATAAVSVEEAVDKLRLRKADFVVAGGVDDLGIEGITGFGDMAATADSSEMEAKGIPHRYFSRANDRRRGGFIESEGGGTLLLARASFAADHGLPVLGVVGFAESFADGAHTSIPAPGLGALGAARGGADSRLARGLRELGVTADDIAVISKHDTSTNANDPNESELHERIAEALGRTPGNPLFVVSQKTVTGHAKGGAAAFQLVGITQVLRSGVIPPNRSLDCVDPVLREHQHLTWLRTALDLSRCENPPRAGLVTSLGFGHVSALVAVVHPGAFQAALAAERGEDAADTWRRRAREREAAGLRRIEKAMRGGPALYERPRERNLGPNGSKEREAAVLLDGSARLVNGVLTTGK
ncbi:type I polyketide synthase [Corynebacterium endometrii]|uniref:3-oxoacyl-[acyl-carrier-protein] synthase 2 n=1 Tax=Corynebacterium endometrii TaxID=2488819 RepID=A0A4P7QHA9_9CORY|nr:type I polyketide synthase [Corynebacterium endometrii]QCB29075.1 3-oxoacyl-[acyl-carrier-protein] synthase 2 [Corynebacterium endometrii]